MERPVVLEASGLCSGYGARRVVMDVSFQVRRGEWIGVLGPNGTGKTTLLKTVSGTLPASAGAVSVFGRELGRWPVKELARRVTVVLQEEETLFPYTVEEVVLMGRSPFVPRFGWESAQDRRMAGEAMEMTGVDGLKKRVFSELSSGERRRVLMARAVAQEPELLLLDEPTAYLDLKHQIELFDLLRQLRKSRELTILMTLHDLNTAAEFCERLLLMKDGSLYKDGSPARVLTASNLLQVYGVKAVVKKNPVTGTPWVMVTETSKKEKVKS